MARGDIFSLNAAREPFFGKMWPAYETEFETPALDDVVASLWHKKSMFLIFFHDLSKEDHYYTGFMTLALFFKNENEENFVLHIWTVYRKVC